jgi:endoglucanase
MLRTHGFSTALSAILALILSSPAVGARAGTSDLGPDPDTVVRNLGHGINLADALEAPREGLWGVTLREDYFATIQNAGFTTVRIPICWSAHASLTSPYEVEPAFFSRIDWVVAEAKAHHLNAILDFQNDNNLIAAPEESEERFLATWLQIAQRYQHEPPSILFELLNEPHGQLDGIKWNALLARTIAVIRPTNPTRFIVVGPVSWNKISALRLLVLPAEDKFLVVTVHYYEPMTFTHQGAPWEKTSITWLGTKWPTSEAERETVDHDFDAAVAWTSAHDRPLLLGEFGTYEKGDIDSRQRWTKCVARSAEAHGMAWAYWEFCGNFGAYDPAENKWRSPLLQALQPNEQPAKGSTHIREAANILPTSASQIKNSLFPSKASIPQTPE